MDWLLYGAYGYTGRLIAKYADRAGMEPILAGRSPEKLNAMVDEYGFERRIIDLTDISTLKSVAEEVDAVVHAAGPFTETAEPMVEACLAGKAHYLDITGEIPVFESIFARNDRAYAKGVALLPGMGFDVVPTDCLAHYVAGTVSSARKLRLFVHADVIPSKGTILTALNQLSAGGMARRQGKLTSVPLGTETLEVDLPDGPAIGLSIPLGDLVTAWHSTGADDINTYVSLPFPFPKMIPPLSRSLSTLLKIPYTKEVLEHAIELLSGLGRSNQSNGHERENWIVAQVEGVDGDRNQAWLRTPETYKFTAISCLEAIKRLRTDQPRGALSPSMAFGEDFVLSIDGVNRYETLPDPGEGKDREAPE
jgi:short subunit dehydrogenase-like uncharacterized protein